MTITRIDLQKLISGKIAGFVWEGDLDREDKDQSSLYQLMKEALVSPDLKILTLRQTSPKTTIMIMAALRQRAQANSLTLKLDKLGHLSQNAFFGNLQGIPILNIYIDNKLHANTSQEYKFFRDTASSSTSSSQSEEVVLPVTNSTSKPFRIETLTGVSPNDPDFIAPVHELIDLEEEEMHQEVLSDLSYFSFRF